MSIDIYVLWDVWMFMETVKAQTFQIIQMHEAGPAFTQG